MTQATSQIGADQSGLAYRNADNAGKQAILNHHKGSTAPTYAEAGIIWLNDSATPWTLNVYNGTGWITLGEINATTATFQPYNGTAAPRMLNFATDTGVANAYAIAPAPAATAYAAGQIVTLKPANANTGAATVNVNSLGAVNIKLLDGNSPAANALLATGVYTLVYDGTDFIVLNPSLPAFTGDGGSGGASGLVPAPAAGDAAAGKVLGANGGWVANGGGPTIVAPAVLSGTAAHFSGLPANITAVDVTFVGLSGSGTSNYALQLGDSGGLVATGYSGYALNEGAGGGVTFSSSFNWQNAAAGYAVYGTLRLRLIDAANNTWSVDGVTQSGGGWERVDGTVSLGAGNALSQFTLTFVNGTDTFDAGSLGYRYQ